MLSEQTSLRGKWIEALRSGTYKQARGKLREAEDGFDSFCCLGVLCDIYDASRWDKVYVNQAPLWNFGMGGIPTVNTTMAPKEVLDAVGISVEFARRLATYNDEGQSFEFIANRIGK